MDRKEIVNIEQLMRGQGNEIWVNQWYGLVTAANFHSLHTWYNTYIKDLNTDATAVVAKVLQYNKPDSHIPALIYGGVWKIED